MVKYFYIFILTLITGNAFGQRLTRAEYIAKYKDYAIIEMHRSGVPASITLAQGILESSDGNSRLATQGNNHFGIKCKSDWTGKTINADDDAPNECFRAYDNALESFRDHSNFLRDNWRYHALFELKQTDYKGWAHGLRKAGYATNRKYDDLIIRIIEQNELYNYDLAPLPGNNMIVVANDIPAVYVQEGETVESIARSNDLKPRQIYRYNEMPSGSEIREGDIVYLKPKRRRGGSKYHVVTEGEDMYHISQMYGIKIKHLYKKNRMELGSEPIPGEKIYMQTKRKKSDSVDVIIKTNFEETAGKDDFVNPNKVTKIQKAPPIQKDNIQLPEYHVVQKGDNIYRIAEKYHVLEEDLLEWNAINAYEMKIGQKIYLTKESAARSAPKVSERTEAVKATEVEESNKIESLTTKKHKVVAGDTVYSICKKYGINQEQLKTWNNMDSVTIYIGQDLIIGQ